MLVPTIFLYSNTAVAGVSYEKIDIKVSILIGGVKYNDDPLYDYQYYTQNLVLKNYCWFAEDTQYSFKPTKHHDEPEFMDDLDILSQNNIEYKYLDNEDTDVLILDGAGWDEVECNINKNLRDQYQDYITNGGGFIGECGASFFPLPLYDEPDTPLEFYWVDENSFLSDMNTRADIKLGFPVISEWIGVHNGKRGDHLKLRKNLNPTAIGIGAYAYYNIRTDEYPNNQSFLEGACFNLTNLDRTHPIMKDFWGDSLFVENGGSSYVILDEGVSCLASYPSDCYEGNELLKLNAWSFSPKFHHVYQVLKILLKLALINQFKVIYLDDLPSEFQALFKEGQEITYIQELIDLLVSRWVGWEKTNEIIKTKIIEDNGNPKPAIIAFNYQNDENKGRLVLSGPHRFQECWWPEEIINHEQEKNHRRDKHGLYHWKKIDGTDWITSADKFWNHDRGHNHTWFFRREVAWASSLVPDNHLPPAYNRSQVIDIYPYMQNSSEFPIYCCVANGRENKWEDVKLKLYYKYYSAPQWSNDWIYYGSTDSKPYKFNFDANHPNALGDGLYRFCSVLETKENGVYTCDEFPPGWDAEVLVNGNISAQFNYDIEYPYAKDSITFNCSESTTKTGTQITSYHWEFGDGNESWDQNPVHTFDDDGVYTVKLTVENNLSQTNYTNKTITIHNKPPNMNINSDYDLIFVNNNVNFTDNSSDVDGNITSWFWDFDDGSNSTTRNTSHIYSNNGYYKFSLEVTDDDNSTNKTYGEILVINSLVNQSRSQQDKIWNNIQDAVDNASTNDLIYVKNGTYTENIIINKTINLVGEDKNNVVIKGSIVMSNPYDYELPTKDTFDYLIVNNMTGIELLMHFNNDSEVGENYSSSNLVVDYSGQNNNGTNNGATWTTFTIKGAGAFDFDGIDDSINLSSISALMGENVTVSAWINCDNGNGVEYPVISQANMTSGYCLYVNNSTMKPCFKLDNDIAISSKAIGINEWYYIVGTYNETDLKVYVDGKLTGNISKNGSGLDTLGFIGFDNNSNYFDGRIDEVAVWNRTLTDEEINLIYESNNGIKIESITFKDSNIGVTPCNHSYLLDCDFINHSIGISLNNTINVMVQLCNITDTDIGINVSGSNPEILYFNSIVDCSIDNITYAINVSNSKNLYVVGTLVNGSTSNLSFSNSDIDNISVINSWSPNNSAPDTPDLSGPAQGDINTSYTYYSYTNDSNNDLVSYFFDWGDGNNSGWTGLGTSGLSNYYYASYKWIEQGGYYVKTKTRDIFDFESNWSVPILFRTENLTPMINMVNNSPDPIGFGFNVTITANITDNMSSNFSGIKTVKVNITYPDDTYVNVSMTDIGNDTYHYVFTDTWLVGKYNYCIWAIDNAYNTNLSSGHSFNVSADAIISVCTIKNSYGTNETVNLTDPPSSSYLVGYELLDDGKVLHIWNNLDHYYFDTDSGIQLTNHYNEYWSHNVLMLGYYNNDQWNLIYRTDELSGFNKNIESDNETYVNATLWKNLNYAGYDFRLTIRYHLGIDDNELTVIPYIKNIDNEDIPYNLGFAWEIKDIQIDMTEENDYIEIDGTTYYLNTSGLDETYTNMDIPSFYIKEDITDTKSESLYLRWDENLNYKVQVKSKPGQYNAPVTLGIKIGTLNASQEKSTELFWYDAVKSTYHFNSYNPYLAWVTNPAYMADGNTSNYASTTIDRDMEVLNINLESAADKGAISKVEIRAFGKYSGSGYPPHDIVLKTVGGTHYFIPDTTGDWSSWYDITNNPNAPNPWTWTDIDNLVVEVEAATESYTLYCSKVDVRITYNPNPVISNPYPPSGSKGITIAPVLNITVSDPEGDTMNITWLSNSSGSWQVFGTNLSVGNGTYHQTFSNATVNGQWWYWKVNVSDGTNTVTSNVFSFYTGYQSKIENTGSTNFTGYLLMQIEFYNTTNSTWILEQVVVNESTPRTINAGCTLALDTIFNPYNVSTSSFTNGNSTYRVYAAFRDPDGDVLVCDDETLLEDSYQFTVSIS